jgi:hypothetical protein
MILRLRSAISLFTCWCFVTTVSASSENIGLVMATGAVQVDGVTVPGNAAIFSGSRISSGSGISNLRLSDGTTVVLRPGAQITVYRDHSVLLRGMAIQRAPDKHAIFADGVKISGAKPNATVLLEVKDGSHFQVAAQGGELEIRTSTGNLVARVEPGKNLGFTISQAPAGTQETTVEICGRLPDNHLLIDTFTSVTYQLQGMGLEPFDGKTVRITGTVVNPSATPPVVTVSSINKVKTCEAPAGPGAAPTAVIKTPLALLTVLLVAAFGITEGVLEYGEGGERNPFVPPVTPSVP